MTEETPLPKPKKPIKAKVLKYFTIKVDITVPAQLSFNILAEDETQALKLYEEGRATLTGPPKLEMARMRKHKATIFEKNFNRILHTKNYHK